MHRWGLQAAYKLCSNAPKNHDWKHVFCNVSISTVSQWLCTIRYLYCDALNTWDVQMICKWALLVMHWSCTISIHKKVKRCITSKYFDWHRILQKKGETDLKPQHFTARKSPLPSSSVLQATDVALKRREVLHRLQRVAMWRVWLPGRVGWKLFFFGVEKWLVMVRDWRFKHTRRVTKSWFGAVWLPGVFKIAHHMGEWFGASISSWEIMMTWDWPKGDELKLANGLEKSLWPKKPWKCPTYVGWLLK